MVGVILGVRPSHVEPVLYEDVGPVCQPGNLQHGRIRVLTLNLISKKKYPKKRTCYTHLLLLLYVQEVSTNFYCNLL